jgi:hypothetical protein
VALTQLADIIEPQYFSDHFAENSMTSTALFQSGVLIPNALMQEQISMGGHLLDIPAWADLQSPADGGADPDISNDNPAQLSAPNKLAAINQSFARVNFLRAPNTFVNQLTRRHSSRGLPWKLSTCAFWVGLPGWMWRRSIFRSRAQAGK